MLLCTTWKVRSMQPEAAQRMMTAWGKLEADMAQVSGMNRLCWYSFSDGSGGFQVTEVNDDAAVHRFGLESSLALGEFLDMETRPVLDLESAMPAITAAMERIAT
ncbi:MAG: DUF3303 family protein [Acidimicrobiales bacterium]